MGETSLQQNYQGVFDRQLSAGRRPAVLVIDFIRAYTHPASPLYAPAVCEAVRATMPLLAAARERGLPIVYTKVLYHPNGQDGGLFVRKVPALRGMVAGEALAEIVPELPPQAEDLVLVKQYASAFFATPLAATLTARGIDTLLIAGCSTSGCVRASAVDCMQHGFVPLVVRDCVGDRHAAPHEANLFDIQAKYGEVVSIDTALAYIASVNGR